MKSPEEHTLSSFDEVVSQSIPEILDSIGCSQRFSFSPLCVSASPTSLFLSAGPLFISSSTVRSNQSSINSSYLNQDVDRSASGGIFVVIPLPAEKSNVDSARYAPANDSFDSFSYLTGSHQNLPRNHSSLGLLKPSNNTHSLGTMFTTRSSTSTTQQSRSVPHFAPVV